METRTKDSGCVFEETLVTILDKDDVVKSIMAKYVKPEMFILTRDTKSHDYKFSKIELMTKLHYFGNFIFYPNDIILTPWHPVRNAYDSGYVFPKLDSRKLSLVESGYKRFGHWNLCTPIVLDFIVENRGDVVLGDSNLNEDQKILMVTLGHNITNDPVAKHCYLGTDIIVNDLKNQSETLKTKILTVEKTIRGSTTKLISKIICSNNIN